MAYEPTVGGVWLDSVRGDLGADYIPTKREIKHKAAIIRKSWTPKERAKRLMYKRLPIMFEPTPDLRRVRAGGIKGD